MTIQKLFYLQIEALTKRSSRHQRGQVAIFVALIFQIVFILFALMINVGLLVHHKINLQNSADLSAYYGAMKQAEMMNVIAHVNFQIRQSWKLLSWRYRILGTFGLTRPLNPTGQVVDLPIIRVAPQRFAYNAASVGFTCAGTNYDPLDYPFMCLGHYGFADSSSREPENLCAIDCSHYAGAKTVIPEIESVPTGGTGPWNTAVIAGINDAIKRANDQVALACDNSAPATVVQLAKYYLSFLQDYKNKMLFIKMLMANLSANELNQLDIDGNLIIDGARRTLQNNLTEANSSSLFTANGTPKDGNVFETFNSLSPRSGGDCSYSEVREVKDPSQNAKLFAEMNHKFIQYFVIRCNPKTGGGKDKSFDIGSIYDATLALDPALKTQLDRYLNNAGSADRIRDVFQENFWGHSTGIEKNPWCPVYYGVKATTTPTIPFLPISRVTLHATAFAKPFGGSMGPRAYKSWPRDSHFSVGAQADRIDRVLPLTNPLPGGTGDLKDNRNLLLNYSLFVGDTKGLADPAVVAAYHDMLNNKSVGINQDTPGSGGAKTKEPTIGSDVKPSVWPAYGEWNNITLELIDTKYDPLAMNVVNGKNSFMRDIEISVVAPNQFDLTYYSIEPDFYNVYGQKLLASKDKLIAVAGLSGTKIEVPMDFGYSKVIQGIPTNFSVRNQLQVVHEVLRAGSTTSPPLGGPTHSDNILSSPEVREKYFTYVPALQGSLLTGWTMKDLVSDKFDVVTQANTKMPFGRCDDDAALFGTGYDSLSSNSAGSGGEKLPPAPGNCITGGRTGYSVKIVNPEALSAEGELGGAGTSGEIFNKPNDFIIF